MRRPVALILTLLVASLLAALIAHAGTASTTVKFRTPDAGAACRLAGPALVCSSLGSAGSISLRQQGSPAIVDRLPWWDASTPVLTHFHHGALTCKLAGSAILCRNHGAAIRVAGDGFAVTS